MINVTDIPAPQANSPLRIIFAGTPDFAAGHLQTLVDSEHEIVAVYTQPDRPSGRGKKVQPTPVKAVALEANIPVFQPASLKSTEEQAQLAEFKADVMVVVAYGLLLPKAVLDIPKYGCMNVHASLLPRWRGAAPIQHAIWANDQQTGVTIMQMDVGLDTGDMLCVATTDITAEDTASSLHDKLLELGKNALLHTLAACSHDALAPEKQDDSLSNYARKLEKTDGLLDWNKTANELETQIRALTPWPGCYSFIGDTRFKVWSALVMPQHINVLPGTILESSPAGILIACAENALLLTELQLPGKKKLAAAEVLNANQQRFQKNYILGMGE